MTSNFISAGNLARAVVVTFALMSGTALAEDKPLTCAEDPAFHQQDFVLGRWDAYTSGRKVAQVRLEKALNDCAIQETWTPVDGKPGKGIGLFAYSGLLKSWSYLWVDESGWTTAFRGSLQSSGNMLYVTEAPKSGGGTRLRHWSLVLQSDKSVKELAEGTDDGKTWTTEYEVLWRRAD